MSNLNSKIEKGRRGEEEAVRFLRSSGYRIVEQNFRSRHGEIDIVAIDRKGKRETVVFVEVKTRTSERFGTAAEAVDARKQRHIINASHDFLAEKGFGDQYVRFDVITVMLGSGSSSVEQYKDAFGDIEA